MNTPSMKDTRLFVHIDHKEPIEFKDFVTSLNSLNDLYEYFVRKGDYSLGESKSCLYVEKIAEGSIDIFLSDPVMASFLEFAEQANVIMEFSQYLKAIFDYFVKGIGDKPEMDSKECGMIGTVMNLPASLKGSNMSIGALYSGNTYNNCVFNFSDSNSLQNIMNKESIRLKESDAPSSTVHERVIMSIFQMRSSASTDIGNKAVIDSICDGKPTPLLFGSDELKNEILFSDENPSKKAYQVDVRVDYVKSKPIYTVLKLHDIINIE